MLALLLSAGLALVHVVAGTLRFLAVVPRSRWLSLAGGISVAYVFAHLLPQVAAGQETLQETGLTEVVIGEGHVWLLSLLGLVVFYGLERAATTSREDGDEAGADRTGPGVFWLHMASYGLYNVLVGYLLGEGEGATATGLVLFWVAMALHFFVNDYGLRQHHKERYDRVGRWVLALAVVAGAAVGLVQRIHPAVIAGLVSFLAGGIVLNVLKEELPEERASRFWPFALGAVGYAVLLAAV
ncbi:hypothetical protein [Rubrivirga marina]|uniref:Uncharacterized protein n=1 Tax=Rubrivirga marina TaxID=1196024 RepID=A0A271J4D1_9BACT|nr:hypothetical protein [Rubrivirga marina]PAP78147.1 hypothetical protein BSZ37_17755 [Rubrivirga marina]